MISRRNTSEDIEFTAEDTVFVYFGDHEAIEQPETFQFCPLGVQLYTHSAVAECELLDCRFTIPGDDDESEEVQCTGLVVQCCEPMSGDKLYRVWVKFLDLPAETVQRIQQLTKNQHFICPFCENF